MNTQTGKTTFRDSGTESLIDDEITLTGNNTISAEDFSVKDVEFTLNISKQALGGGEEHLDYILDRVNVEIKKYIKRRINE